MTENTMEILREHAARLVDEAQRLQRMLVWRSDLAIAREHLGNIEAMAALCRRDGLAAEALAVPDVPADVEPAPEPEPEPEANTTEPLSVIVVPPKKRGRTQSS